MKPIINDSSDGSFGLSRLLSVWPDPAVVIDCEGIIVAASARGDDLLCGIRQQIGTPAHHLLCVQAREYQHDESQCPFSCDIGGALVAGEDLAQWHSAYWCTLSGDYLSVDARPSALDKPFEGLVVWSFVDNNTRRHNQAELQKFAQFVDMSPSAIAEFDVYGQLMFANAALQEIMLEAGFNDFGQSCVIPAGIEQICSMTAGLTDIDDNSGNGGAKVTVELNGQFFEWHFYPLTDLGREELDTVAHDATTTVLGFAFNVTVQKAAELTLAKAQSDARRDFYAKMIHELRTPLNAIMGFSDILIRRTVGRLDSREAKNLQAIKNAGFQLNELVTDTLDISKIEAGHMELQLSTFNVNELCMTFISQIEALSQAKGLVFECAIKEDIFVRTDRQKVRQILINLLSNAIKYTQLGWVRLDVVNQSGMLVITVSDSGIGIPEAQIGKLFKSYQQVDDKSTQGIQGTGLGLALVQELVILLDGTIAVNSQHKKGSVFTLSLPVLMTE